MTTKTITEAQLAATHGWLTGALLVAFGSIERGEYEGRAAWDAKADRMIGWLAENGMRLTLDPETALPVTGLDVERLARASHARCIAQWEADRQTDPDRMLTMHDWDAHVPATRKDAAEYARLTSSPTAEEKS